MERNVWNSVNDIQTTTMLKEIQRQLRILSFVGFFGNKSYMLNGENILLRNVNVMSSMAGIIYRKCPCHVHFMFP